METYRRLSELPEHAATVLTIGNFDGLHKGHLQVIEQLVDNARERNLPAVVITFHPHPRRILNKGKAAQDLIVTLDKKLELLESAGVDRCLVVPFDEQFSAVTAQEFLESVIIKRFHPELIVVGFDHHFGHRREGDLEFLQSMASKFQFTVEVVEEVNSGALAINSTRIRELLKAGDLVPARELLGWTYEIPVRIIEGSGRGRKINFPTANFIPDNPSQLIPGNGVYIVSTQVENKNYFGMCNIGYRPTFEGTSLGLEAHFFDWSGGEMYDMSLIIKFYHRIRDEQKFNSVVELQTQLRSDKEFSLKWISNNREKEIVNASIK
ncbi:bifunctional riboflavin kinase/FAD synthetase [Candidatus Neomarinimicrobiota bacterium]